MIEDKKSPQVARVHSQDTIYTGNVFSFVSDELTLDGQDTVLRREYISHPGAVAIITLRDGEAGPEVLLQSQYRHPIGVTLWEAPAGLLDKEGEDPLNAAQRELAEEAGLQAERWDVLVDLFSTPGCVSESLRVFLARDVSEAHIDYVRSEEEADMVPAWISLDDAYRLALSGRLHNSTTIVGILAARTALAEGTELRQPDADWLR